MSYFHPKILVVLLLGFSSGLPRLLVGGTMAAWLATYGIDKAAIGFSAYVLLPYTFNFVWAPIIDQMRLPLLGRCFGQRISWMLLTQACLAAALLLMANTSPAENLALFIGMAVMVAFFSSCQDVVIDAYRTEYLDENQYGEGAAIAVFGYRVGMLVASAGALSLADHIDWSTIYQGMAALLGIGMLTALLAGEPERKRELTPAHGLQEWIARAVIAPFRVFIGMYEHWLLILLLIAFYRVPDGFISQMVNVFYLDVGYTKTQIGLFGKLYGFFATSAGAFAGGYIVHKIGIRRALGWFILAQMATNLAYILITVVGAELWALALAITFDNLAGGLLITAAIAFQMRLCHKDYTATQYALFSSLASQGSTLFSGPAGIVADSLGWEAMFFASALLGVPSLLILLKLRASTVWKGIGSQ